MKPEVEKLAPLRSGDIVVWNGHPARKDLDELARHLKAHGNPDILQVWATDSDWLQILTHEDRVRAYRFLHKYLLEKHDPYVKRLREAATRVLQTIQSNRGLIYPERAALDHLHAVLDGRPDDEATLGLEALFGPEPEGSPGPPPSPEAVKAAEAEIEAFERDIEASAPRHERMRGA